MEEKRQKHALAEKKYLKKKKENPDFKQRENLRVERLRKLRVNQMNSAQLKSYKDAAADRKRKSRANQKSKDMPPQVVQPAIPSGSGFKKPQSLGKAIKRSLKSLPVSPRKQK